MVEAEQAMRERLFARVYASEPGIVMYREIAQYNSESIELMMSRVMEIARAWPSFAVIVDLREPGMKRATAESRSDLRRWLVRLRPRMAIMLVITDNLVMRVACRLLGFAVDIRLEFCADDAEGLARAHSALETASASR